MLVPAVAIALDQLRANPLRTLLSTLGIVMGVGALVAVLSVGDGMERFARAQVAETTSLHAVVVEPRTSRMIDGQRVPLRDWPRLGVAELSLLEARLPMLLAGMVERSGVAYVRLPGDTAARAAAVRAIAGADTALARTTLVAGRHLTSAESRDTLPVAEISARLAQLVAAPDAAAAAVGRVVALGGRRFTIVGVHADLGPEALSAVVPFATAERVLETRGDEAPARLVLAGARVEAVRAMRDSAVALLATRIPDAAARLTVQSSEFRLQQIERGLLVFKLFMGAITGISLLVGGIGIMNVLLASVAERTREIGVRKAAGARHRDILAQFLAESLAITGVGSAVGATLGIAGAFAVTALMRARADAVLHASVSASTVLVVAVVATLLGLSFGTYPALRAARLSPIDAIRHES